MWSKAAAGRTCSRTSASTVSPQCSGRLELVNASLSFCSQPPLLDRPDARAVLKMLRGSFLASAKAGGVWQPTLRQRAGHGRMGEQRLGHLDRQGNPEKAFAIGNADKEPRLFE